jgi:hypothetical protein
MQSKENIKKLAYEIYERNGRRDGRELLDWLAAEQIIRFEQMIFSGMGPDGIGLLEYKPVTAVASNDLRSGPSAARSRIRLNGRARKKSALGA